MNKLLLLCLLSILILYIQCTTACAGAKIGKEDGQVASCSAATVTDKDKQFCAEDDDEANKGNCKEYPKCKFGTQGEAVSGKTTTVKDCTKLETSDSSKFTCRKSSATSQNCEEVEKATNSGSILNAFKISFALIIIFAIL